jgi:molybdopterin-guanine dinucleotide biosynthesis protein A
MTHAGIILCGGRSSRMGVPKLALPFGPESMLARVMRLMGEACKPIVVVAAPGQELPADVNVRDARFKLARDQQEGRGPLEGLLAGLSALPAGVEAAYVTGCDVPFLQPAFVQRMFALLGDNSIAVPVVDGFQHPLAAVYRPTLVAVVEALLATDRRAPKYLFDTVPTRRVTASELIDVDPSLATLENLNRPEEYLAALAKAGFEAPRGMV